MSRALILAPFSSYFLERLRQRLEVTYESWLDTRRIFDPEELGSRISGEGFTILVIEADFVFEEVFQQARKLKFVGICRSTTDHVDLEAATRNGVTVVNTPGRNAQAVAEHTLGLMLALARGIPKAHRYVKEGCWQDPTGPYTFMRGVELAGRTLGVVGLGSIGKRVAALGIALGMKLIAYDPYVKEPPSGVALAGLDELMASVDFITLHVPPMPATEALLDARRLALMRPMAYLINTSYAGAVDQVALVELLKQGRIAGAALDVFETHPLPPHSPLLVLPNVVLTPHLGGATQETIERHSQMMAEDILRYLEGQRPLHLVNAEEWEHRDQ